MTMRRLLWAGKRGYARCGDVLVRLRRPPVLPQIGEYEALAFAPPKMAAVTPAEAQSRHLSRGEIKAIVRLLERMRVNVEDVLDDQSSLVVIVS